MTELEKAARGYADGLRSVDKKNTYDNIEVDSSRMVAFKRGAEWQSKQSPWIRTENKMPEDNELVLTFSSIYGTKLLVWNEQDNTWDDEDGDDCYCDRYKIDDWMPIPE